MGAPPVPAKNKQKFRELFKGTLILSGGYDAGAREKDLTDGRCNLMAVGRPISCKSGSYGALAGRGRT